VLYYNFLTVILCLQVMESSWSEAEKWNPMLDDFNNERFNPPACESSDIVQLFVYGIPPCLTEQGLRNLMSPVAKILRIAVLQHRNIGFVSVRQQDAVKVIAYFNNFKLGDSYLTVKLSKSYSRSAAEQAGAVSRTATRMSTESGNVEQNEALKSNSSTFVSDLTVPPLHYPSAAKYVQIGQELAVKVLNVVSPSQFWICRYLCDADGKLMELNTKLQNHYSSLPPKRGFRPNGSGLYAALMRGSGKWCRVQALNFDTESVSVLLLDYGTCERVSLTELHSLEGQFCVLPFQAMCCSLAHVRGTPQWSEEAANCMRQLLADQQIRAQICNIDGYTLSVKLILSSGQTVNDLLVSRNCASYEEGYKPSVNQTNTEQTAASDNAAEYPTTKDMNFVRLTVDEQYDMVVLHARNDKDVTVCQSDSLGKLAALLAELSRYTLSGSYFPRVGEIVATLYDDGSWYRAEVLSLIGNSAAAVHFVDFGNTADVKLSSIVRLNPEHVAIPVYGINAMFCSNVDSELLAEYCILTLKVVEQRDNCYVVSRVEDGTKMNSQSVESPATTDKLSSDSSPSTCESKPETKSDHPVVQSKSVLASLPDAELQRLCLSREKVVVVHADSPGSFYIQPCSDSAQKDLASLHQSIANYCEQSPCKSGTVAVGQIVGVMCDNGVWRRGEVVDLELGGKFRVQLVDYGVTTTVDSGKLRPLPDSPAVSLPRQAIHCAIDRVVCCETNGSWSPTAMKWIQTVCRGGDLFVLRSIYESDSGNMFVVDLINVATGKTAQDMLLDEQLVLSGKDVSPKSSKSVSTKSCAVLPDMGAKPEKTSVPVILSSMVKSAQILAGETVQVTYIQSPVNFYVQQQNESSTEVLQEMNKHCMTCDMAYRPRQVGELVAVMHDNYWYRAEVMSLNTSTVNVVCIDSGNTVDNVDAKNIRTLTMQFATGVPRLAVRCALGGLRGTREDRSFTEVACMYFRDCYLHVPSTVTKVKQSGSSNALLINLKTSTSGKTARKSLLDYGMALESADTDRSTTSVSQVQQVQPQIDTTSKITQPCVKPTLTERLHFEDAALLHVNDTVCIVHIVSSADFYCISSDPTALQDMMSLSEKLAQYCKVPDSEGYRPQYVGQPIAAKFDGDWFRAEVVKLMSDDRYEVFFVDYGNTEVVGAGDIRSLPKDCLKYPKAAVHCGIDDSCDSDGGKLSAGLFKEKFSCGSKATLLSVRVVDRKHWVNMQ